MVDQATQECKAKIFEMGGTIRGWIPTPVARYLKARDGDYMVFHMNEFGKVKVTTERPTAYEKKRSKARKTKK
jgi:hypothetical protein